MFVLFCLVVCLFSFSFLFVLPFRRVFLFHMSNLILYVTQYLTLKLLISSKGKHIFLVLLKVHCNKHLPVFLFGPDIEFPFAHSFYVLNLLGSEMFWNCLLTIISVAAFYAHV